MRTQWRSVPVPALAGLRRPCRPPPPWVPRRLSPGAKRVEHHATGPAGLRQAELGLIRLDGLVRLGANCAIRRADIIAALRQESLDLLALGAREATIVRRPGAHEGTCPL